MNKAFQVCLQHFGLKEIKGKKHEEKIIEAFKLAGFGWIKDDETAWCAAWMVYCFHHAGMEPIKTVRAREWQNYGNETKTPKLGDIVTFWRISKASNYGHVGFYVNENETHIQVLGGNQSNSVSIQWYKKSQLLSYREVVEPVDTQDHQYDHINMLTEEIEVLTKELVKCKSVLFEIGEEEKIIALAAMNLSSLIRTIKE